MSFWEGGNFVLLYNDLLYVWTGIRTGLRTAFTRREEISQKPLGLMSRRCGKEQNNEKVKISSSGYHLQTIQCELCSSLGRSRRSWFRASRAWGSPASSSTGSSRRGSPFPRSGPLFEGALRRPEPSSDGGCGIGWHSWTWWSVPWEQRPFLSSWRPH